MKGKTEENSKNSIRELLGRRRWMLLAVSLVLIFSLAMVYSQETGADGSNASSDIDKYVTGSASSTSDSVSADASNGASSTSEKRGGTDCIRELNGE